MKFIMFSIFLSSCGVIGSSTLYKAKNIENIKVIGLLLTNGDNSADKLYYKSSTVFRETTQNIYSEYGLGHFEYINHEISYKDPNIMVIAELCRKHEVEGIILAILRFQHGKFKAPYIQPEYFYNAEVELKLFSKDGELLLSTVHNTLSGNPYIAPLTIEKAIQDATIGAMKRVFKELRIKKI